MFYVFIYIENGLHFYKLVFYIVLLSFGFGFVFVQLFNLSFLFAKLKTLVAFRISNLEDNFNEILKMYGIDKSKI